VGSMAAQAWARDLDRIAAAVRGARWCVGKTRAVCAGMGSGLFLPIGAMGSALEQAEQAKAVCARCPVITQCLD